MNIAIKCQYTSKKIINFPSWLSLWLASPQHVSSLLILDNYIRKLKISTTIFKDSREDKWKHNGEQVGSLVEFNAFRKVSHYMVAECTIESSYSDKANQLEKSKKNLTSQ